MSNLLRRLDAALEEYPEQSYQPRNLLSDVFNGIVHLNDEAAALRQQLKQAEARVAELESVCKAVASDLRDRARTDSDGCRVINLSGGVWFRLRQQADEAERAES